MSIALPLSDAVYRIIDAALAEDIGTGDVTASRLIPESAKARLAFVAREALVACGGHIVPMVFERLSRDVRCELKMQDGQGMRAGEAMIVVQGNARVLLSGERTALNLLQRMCSVATLTRRYVDAVAGTGAQILDTRKTMPGLRTLDKYAVRAGGGRNHRMGLYDAILIKDNHIALCGGVGEAVRRAKSGGGALPIEVECDALAQVEEAVAAGVETIMLDNMTLDVMREAVQRVAGRAKLEASGNVSLDTARAIAQTGVDFISVGRITHSAPNVDIGLDVVIDCSKNQSTDNA